MISELEKGELLQRFVEELPDCAVFILDPQGKVLTWNAGAHSILGYTADDIVGSPFAALHADAGAGASSADAMDVALAQGRHEDTRLMRHKDGRLVRVRSVLLPLHDSRDRHIGFGNLTRDIEHMVATAAAPPPQDLAERRRAQQILVVDDDAEVRAVAVRQLTSLGYRVISAAGGAEALDLLDGGADVDLLFIDVMMPNGMNGRDCAERAVATRPGLKVLFASGYFEGALVQRGEIDRHVSFLVKPYRKKDLAAKVQQVLTSS
jgi:PAS domain S-box-containing protein